MTVTSCPVSAGAGFSGNYYRFCTEISHTAYISPLEIVKKFSQKFTLPIYKIEEVW